MLFSGRGRDGKKLQATVSGPAPDESWLPDERFSGRWILLNLTRRSVDLIRMAGQHPGERD